MIFILIPLLVAVSVFWDAWAFMILVGVIHAEWLPMLPTIGFGSSVIISFLFLVLMAPAILLGSNK